MVFHAKENIILLFSWELKDHLSYFLFVFVFVFVSFLFCKYYRNELKNLQNYSSLV